MCYLQSSARRVRIVYRGLGRAFVVNKNRDLEGKNFLAALGLVCMLVTPSQHGVAVRMKKQKREESDSLKKKEHKKAQVEKIVHKSTPPPRKGWGEERMEARILQTNPLYSIQGPCFMDNKGSA
jgi:hypothetical protein